MLIWGSSSVNVKQQFSVDGSCVVCGHTQFILHATQRYGHLWWIPLIPLNKIFHLTCLQCQSSISNNSVENFIENIDPGIFKTPFWSYSGWLVLLCLIPLAFLPSPTKSGTVEPKNYVIRNVNAPVKTHDFLVLHSDKELGYILARVLKVEDKKISFQFSKLLYTKKSMLDSIAKTSNRIFQDDFYNEDYYEATIEELTKELQLKDIIFRQDNPRV